MEIRSITLFCEPDYAATQVSAFFDATRRLFPVPVQTRRVALTPFPQWWTAGADREAAYRFSERWQAAGADYVSLGPVLLEHDVDWIARLPALLGAGDALFASAEIANTRGEIDPARAKAVAKLIETASTIQANGFGNLYFTALANCPPGSPFFPVAYHAGGPPAFALAIEGADLAVTAFREANTLAEARQRLVSAIEAEADALVTVAAGLAEAQESAFAGLDFSLAPFPTQDKSLAAALEALGLPSLGSHGSLFAASFVAEALSRADFPRCGFSGLMLPVLEDSVLALRAGNGQVTIQDLLSYAAVCGVGLDTIPLPGKASPDRLAGILLDVAALACRLDKPLTARLMPLPGLKAGDPIHFDFPYFADSRVMPLAPAGANGLLQQAARIELKPAPAKRRGPRCR